MKVPRPGDRLAGGGRRGDRRGRRDLRRRWPLGDARSLSVVRLERTVMARGVETATVVATTETMVAATAIIPRRLCGCRQPIKGGPPGSSRVDTAPISFRRPRSTANAPSPELPSIHDPLGTHIGM